MTGGGFKSLLSMIILVLLFALSLSLSAAPRLFETFAPLQYLPLICLGCAVILTAGEFPLLLLFLFGLLIDSVHNLTLGSSSLLLVLIMPYIQLLSRSALRFSFLRAWVLFTVFLLLYQGGQSAIQYLVHAQISALPRLALDTLAAVLLFPVIFAIILYCSRRLRGTDTLNAP